MLNVGRFLEKKGSIKGKLCIFPGYRKRNQMIPMVGRTVPKKPVPTRKKQFDV